eukprot:9502473-Pyramimonas_sp.AAC.1
MSSFSSSSSPSPVLSPASWAISGRSPRPLGTSWTLVRPNNEYAKLIRVPEVMVWYGLRLLGPSWGSSGSRLGYPWA